MVNFTFDLNVPSRFLSTIKTNLNFDLNTLLWFLSTLKSKMPVGLKISTLLIQPRSRVEKKQDLAIVQTFEAVSIFEIFFFSFTFLPHTRFTSHPVDVCSICFPNNFTLYYCVYRHFRQAVAWKWQWQRILLPSVSPIWTSEHVFHVVLQEINVTNPFGNGPAHGIWCKKCHICSFTNKSVPKFHIYVRV